MIECCIFDLDGTLCNTVDTITHYVNAILERHGIEKITAEECKLFIGNGAVRLIGGVLSYRGIKDKDFAMRLYREYDEAYNRDAMYLTSAFEGIAELLEELCSAGIKTAVLSNKPDTAVSAVVNALFGDRFNITQGAREGAPLKPDASGVLSIASELSVSVDKIMFVGDSDVDMYTGRNAGVGMCMGVSWGFRSNEELRAAGADKIAEHPLDIYKEAVSFA